MEEIKNKRIIYYDVLNIMAILAVVSMHLNGVVHSNPNIRAWNSALIVECICYWAVPMFVMISGAKLLRYREKYDTKTFFKKRFTKILIPLIFWATFMFIWKIFIIHSIKASDIQGIKGYLNAFLANEEEPIYYFLFDILGVYLTMPIISLLAKPEYKKTLWLTVVLFLVFNSTLPNIFSVLGLNYNNSFSVNIGRYTIIAIMGYLLSIEDVPKKRRIGIYIIAILGLVYRYITTFIWSKQAGRVITKSWTPGYSSWFCIALTAAIFLFVKNINIEKKLGNNKKVLDMLSKISSCSFGVYLIHLFVFHYEMSIVTRISTLNSLSWQVRTFGIITTYLISLIIVLIIKKIPVLRRIVP